MGRKVEWTSTAGAASAAIASAAPAHTSAALILAADGAAILGANAEACRLLGYAERELAALPPAALLADPEGDGLCARLSGTAALRHRDGRAIACRTTLARIEVSGEECLVVTLRATGEGDRESRMEALLRVAIEQLPEALIIYDSDDRLLYFNRAYHEYFPYMPPFEELEGRHFFDVIRHSMAAPEVVLDPLLDRDSEAYLNKRLERLHHPAPEAFEQETGGRWHLVREQRVPGVGFVGMRRDITDEKRLRDEIEEREALFRTLVETAPFALVLTRISDQRVVMINRRAAQLFGLSVEEAPGRCAADFYAFPADRERLIERIRREGRVRDVEVRVKDLQGNSYWVLISGSVTNFGGERVLLLGLVDISTRRHQETLVAQTNQQLAELADRLERACAEADAARLRAESANRSKSEFLAMMSHELRTPLNAVIGFASLLGDQTFGALGHERYVEYAEVIRDSGMHLLAIINDILDLAKVEAGKMDIQPVWLNAVELSRDCISLVRGIADTRGVTVSADLEEPGRRLFADPRAAKQMLVNLLSNACKFTEAGGQVELSLADGDGGATIVRVRDTGIGMSEADLERAMEPFGQVSDVVTRSRQGTGLGLPLVKSFTELHGGSLRIESEPGVGTCVELTFPPQE